MSHATVMVLGPKNEAELDEAMAPFNEEIEVEPYFDPVTWLLEQREKGETLEAFAARKNAEWEYGPDDEGALLVRDGVLGSMTTYNPLSKWDWYQVGGRWRGSLPLTAEAQLAGEGIVGEPGVFDNGKMFDNGVDVVRLGDIDVHLMRVNAAANADEAWQKMAAAIGDRPLPPLPADDADREVWQAWWNSPVLLDVKKAFDGMLFTSPHDIVEMMASREHHIQRAVAGAVPCFATLVPGEGWLEPGKMGWFGVSSDNGESRDEYYEKVNKMLDAADPDTMVWVVDFHI